MATSPVFDFDGLGAPASGAITAYSAVFENYTNPQSPMMSAETWNAGGTSSVTIGSGSCVLSASAANGYASHRSPDVSGAGTPGFRLGQGYSVVHESKFTMPSTLGTAANEYVILSGLFQSVWNGVNTGGVLACCFVYDSQNKYGGSVTHKLKAYTRNAGTTNFTTTEVGTALTAGQTVTLRVEVEGDGSEARFYVDGTLVATHTTHIYTATNMYAGADLYLVASTGSARQVTLDYQHFLIGSI